MKIGGGGSSDRGGRALGTRLLLAAALATLLLGVLVARLYTLQIAHGELYAEKSQENFIKELRVPASRGMILDRHGVPLVDERPSYDVFLTPAFCKRCDETVARLADVLGLEAEEIQKVNDQVKRARGLVRFRAFPVKVDVPRDDLDRLNAHLLDLQGVDVVPTPHRNYRFGPVAAHLLGYMNEISPDELARQSTEEGALRYLQGDYVGRRGLERRYERELRGRDGIERVVVDARGNRIAQKASLIREEERLVPAVPGNNLVLSIDMRLQQAAEQAFPGKAGAVVALDANTGDVLAVVSRPSFDPNKMSGRITREELRALVKDPYLPLLFRPTQQQYSPGSTFKVVTALAALEQGSLGDHSVISCGGGYQLGKRRWRCDKESGHGGLGLELALAASCDVFFYALADRMGIEPIAQTARALGLGSPTGLDLGHEVPGIVPSTAWHNRYTPGGYQRGFALNTAIGQGDTNATPMQMAVLYAALGNGGVVYRPHLVRRIEDADGRVLTEVAPEVERRLPVQADHLEAVVEGLRMVVNNPSGTAFWQRPIGEAWDVAGKTGTAQVVAMGDKRLHEKDLEYWQKSNSWFAAFAPSHSPEIAVVVLNEHGGFGASAAAPTAMAVIKAYFDLKAQDAAALAARPPGMPPPPPDPLAPPPAPAPPVLRKRRTPLTEEAPALAEQKPPASPDSVSDEPDRETDVHPEVQPPPEASPAAPNPVDEPAP